MSSSLFQGRPRNDGRFHAERAGTRPLRYGRWRVPSCWRVSWYACKFFPRLQPYSSHWRRCSHTDNVLSISADLIFASVLPDKWVYVT